MNQKQVLLFLTAGFANTAFLWEARAIDPREGMGAPAGTDYFQFLAVRNEGSGYWVNGTKVSSDARFTANGEAFRYGHFWNAGRGMTFLAATVFPFHTNITVSGSPVGNQSLKAAGLTDATAILAVWPVADAKNKKWFGTAVWITAPTGCYDRAKPLNVGRNVWTFRPEVVWVRGWSSFYLQLVGDLYIDTDNTEYGAAARTLRRDVLFAGEVHGSYNLTPACWVGFSGYYANGYRSKILETGLRNNDRQRDQTIGVSINYVLAKHLSVLVSSKYKCATYNGFEQAEIIRVKLTCAF